MLADQLGGAALTEPIVEHTQHTCYHGVRERYDGHGCGECPACALRARRATPKWRGTYVTLPVKEILLHTVGRGANAGRPAVFTALLAANLWRASNVIRATAVCWFCTPASSAPTVIPR